MNKKCLHTTYKHEALGTLQHVLWLKLALSFSKTHRMSETDLATQVEGVVAAAASVDQITLKYALTQLTVAESQAQDPEFRARLRELLFSAVERRMARESTTGSVSGAAVPSSAEEKGSTADKAADDSDSSSSSDDSSDSSSSSESEGEAGAGGESLVDASSPSKRKKAAGGSGVFSREMVLSAPLVAFFGTPRLPRGEAAKRLWAYVRESSLAKNPRGQYVCDDKLSAALGGRKTLDFKSAAKALAAGMKDPRDLVGGGADRDDDDDSLAGAGAGGAGAGAGRAAGAAAKRGRDRDSDRGSAGRGASNSGGAGKASAKRPRLGAAGPGVDLHDGGDDDRASSDSETGSDSGSDSDSDSGAGLGELGAGSAASAADKKSAKASGKGKGGFAREVPVSETMASFLGSETGSRSGAVKAIWVHVKAAGLQKPQDKRVIILDDRLKPLFPSGTKTVTMFSMVSLRVSQADAEAAAAAVLSTTTIGCQMISATRSVTPCLHASTVTLHLPIMIALQNKHLSKHFHEA